MFGFSQAFLRKFQANPNLNEDLNTTNFNIVIK